MKIGIDASWAAVTGTGTASYTRGLVQALVACPGHDWILYFKSGDEEVNPLWNLDHPTVDRRVVGEGGQLQRTLISLTGALHEDKPDLFHSPGYFLPLWEGPKVVTFHDANMFSQWRAWWRPGMRVSWLSLCGQSILASRLARRVLSDSAVAAHQVRDVLHLPPRKVEVLYPGVDDRFFGERIDGSEAGEHFELHRYLLFVGVLSPQKNLEGMVRAFAELGNEDLTLCLAGREDGPYYAQVITPLIAALGLKERVRHLGVVPEELLPSLYAGAQAFLFPSFAEGFGLPPLEAMACGTPVIASNRSCLPEVLDHAALLVDPERPEQIAAAMHRMLHDQDLAQALGQQGRERAASFRWNETARRAVEIYERVA